MPEENNKPLGVSRNIAREPKRESANDKAIGRLAKYLVKEFFPVIAETNKGPIDITIMILEGLKCCANCKKMQIGGCSLPEDDQVCCKCDMSQWEWNCKTS